MSVGLGLGLGFQLSDNEPHDHDQGRSQGEFSKPPNPNPNTNRREGSASLGKEEGREVDVPSRDSSMKRGPTMVRAHVDVRLQPTKRTIRWGQRRVHEHEMSMR